MEEQFRGGQVDLSELSQLRKEGNKVLSDSSGGGCPAEWTLTSYPCRWFFQQTRANVGKTIQMLPKILNYFVVKGEKLTRLEKRQDPDG